MREEIDSIGNLEMHKAEKIRAQFARHWRQYGSGGAAIAVSSTQKHT